MFQLSHKDSLWRNLRKMIDNHSSYDFIPHSFLLPSEKDLFWNSITSFSSDSFWISKPTGLGEGRDIKIYTHGEIMSSREDLELKWKEHSVVIQRYIHNPLLINGLKVDLRIYVAITNLNPFQICIFKNGIVRSANSSYSTSSLDPSIHLCNNKIHRQYNTRANETNWTLDQFEDWINDHRSRDDSSTHIDSDGLTSRTFLHGYDFIFNQIKDIARLTISSCAHLMKEEHSRIEESTQKPIHCFELFGFDILVDDNLKCWLLEVIMALYVDWHGHDGDNNMDIMKCGLIMFL